jgi:hypothetical protein
VKVAFTVIRAFFGQLPGWLWIVMAAGLLAAGAYRAHEAAKDALYAKGYRQGVMDNEASHIAANAAEVARENGINTKIRKRNDEENRRIAADADALRLRGPGKAACSSPGIPHGRAGGQLEGRGEAPAPVAEVPDPQRIDLIALPFASTVTAFQQCDANRAEVLSRRESDRLLATPQQ